MPLRAVGYVASAVTIAAAFFPKAQVQMVHALNTAQKVNAIDVKPARKQAELFAAMSKRIPGMSVIATHLTDPMEPLNLDRSSVAEALETLPTHASARLQKFGSGKGSTLDYVIAHVQMHDTAAALPRLSEDTQQPIVPRRIISVGGQSERPFYLARMACRQRGVEFPNVVESTAQLFTRHVLSPYRMCREGEPHIVRLDRTYPLRQPLEWDYDPLYELEQPNLSVARDLGHIASFLRTREDPGTRQLLNFTARLQGGEFA